MEFKFTGNRPQDSNEENLMVQTSISEDIEPKERSSVNDDSPVVQQIQEAPLPTQDIIQMPGN